MKMEQHYRYTPHDHATSNVLAWSATNSANVEPSVEEDAGADTDEPPDCPPLTFGFQRTPVRRGSEHHESLLTKAFQSHSEEENHAEESLLRRRRRSIVSNFSFASTAELTCDTGLTTPARTSSPSPRFSTMGFVPLSTMTPMAKTPVPAPAGGEKDAVQALQKKRCISFACAAKPKTDDKVSMPPPPLPKAAVDAPKTEAAPKKTTIKFACPAQPPRPTDASKSGLRPMTPVPAPKYRQKSRSPSTVRAPRGSTSRALASDQAIAKTKKWLDINASDLQSECAQFHEFASEGPQEDDWIKRDDETGRPKLTIQDTLEKENAIRKLGKEAEEEADLEEGLDDEVNEEEDDEEDADDDEDESPEDDEDDLDEDSENDEADEDDVEDDADTEHNWDEEASDGYKTDSEIGFAESDDEDDDLVLWTTRVGHHTLSGVPLMRRSSIAEQSDSSACSQTRISRKMRSKSRPVPIRPHTPELPDSTDFVCGTLDEDRPLEDAYISCVEARKRNKLMRMPLPQDIDPSFPTSEPEDEVEEAYTKAYNESDDHGWLHGEFEDLHHERDRRGRKKGQSPMRLRSPPPKRHPSPAPKSRGRSPRKLSDRQSPRRMRSPAPACMAYRSSAATSPGEDSEHIPFKVLALRPGLNFTKSLPRAPGMLPHLKSRKSKATSTKNVTHVRGAIDIVKGLEQKRQRRKEKFYQKYCSRARKEKAQPRRPPPGQGAERMRELGLIMAGKAGPGHYVLSI
ncbi:hypothetical protein QBC35DRAFT_112249 [Podospora australis]|uniref:Uncharacterized protein n=1 Tax=Podospora australis TaxID=1536484 RepID=A0AAN7AKJ1_9PEZI|nr:hypothetical protein QBC35DRAFT_112249 [Podospora australis]